MFRLAMHSQLKHQSNHQPSTSAQAPVQPSTSAQAPVQPSTSAQAPVQPSTSAQAGPKKRGRPKEVRNIPKNPAQQST
jgi:hypothetical protein